MAWSQCINTRSSCNVLLSNVINGIVIDVFQCVLLLLLDELAVTLIRPCRLWLLFLCVLILDMRLFILSVILNNRRVCNEVVCGNVSQWNTREWKRLINDNSENYSLVFSKPRWYSSVLAICSTLNTTAFSLLYDNFCNNEKPVYDRCNRMASSIKLQLDKIWYYNKRAKRFERKRFCHTRCGGKYTYSTSHSSTSLS